MCPAASLECQVDRRHFRFHGGHGGSCPAHWVTGLSWLCYFRALKLGEVSQVAPVDKLSVAIAILLAVIFLGERIQWQQGIGATLIVIGVMIMVVKF